MSSLENDTDTRTNGQHYIPTLRPPADQSGKRVASWTGKSPDTHDLLGLRSCSRRMSLGCYAENSPVEFELNGVLAYVCVCVCVCVC